MAKKKAAKKRPVKAARPKTAPTIGTSRVRYKKNFLKQVIVRIDFASPVLPTHPPIAEVIHGKVKKSFPVSEQKKHVHNQLNFGAGGVSSSSSEFAKWVCRSKDGNTLTIDNTAVTITYAKYNAYENLRGDFLATFEALIAQIPALTVTRIGLRYINNIEIRETSPTQWEKYLHSNLLGIFNIATDRGTISRTFQVLEFNYDGETKMRFQFGMPNPDYPARIKKKLFVLDYDIFHEGTLLHADVEKTLDQYHDKINSAFEEVITDGLRKKMEVIRG